MTDKRTDSLPAPEQDIDEEPPVVCRKLRTKMGFGALQGVRVCRPWRTPGRTTATPTRTAAARAAPATAHRTATMTGAIWSPWAEAASETDLAGAGRPQALAADGVSGVVSRGEAAT
jgi:hypothetical protein